MVLERWHIHKFTAKVSSCGKNICVGKSSSFMKKRRRKENNMSIGKGPED